MWWLEELILLISLFPLLWLFGASLRLMKRSDRSDYEDDEAAPSSSEEDEAEPSPPPVREEGFQYDVFLSFRGRDTRKGFTSHLYQALQDKDIHTFIDTEGLEKGHKVEELFNCIEKSQIFVPIFSKGYADSMWCLKDIAKMVECKRLIIPVFFDVEPRDVRGQSGSFEPAFRRYGENDKTNKEEVRKWRNALIKAGEFSGYTLADAYGDEATLVKRIVKGVLNEVNRTRQPFVAPALRVGLDSHIAELVEVLDVKAQNDVKMVGIHGIGDIDKTTLAMAVYNQIFSHFDACSFILNIRESKLVSLQEQLLRDVFNDKNVKVNNIDHGISMIKGRIWSKKVLLVLDDVDSKSQLGALAGSLNWFCSGSRIIITTRDKQVLRDPMLKKNDVYELKTLDATQSLELFCWSAFEKKEPDAPPSSSHSPPPVREDGFQYDVFLSFRGPDTRNGFTGHLYHALKDKGIHTFIDSEKLEKGQKVEKLFEYIERSKILVPIFSQGYADSKWCLNEIAKMVECKRLIIPVFFDVEPRVVRHQSGPFAHAFTRYNENDITNKEEVRKWSDALKVAADVSGYILAYTDGYEAKLIKLIVKKILTEVNNTPLFVAEHRVGLDSRVAELVEVLEVEAQNGVKIVGIHGIGGIGKTTLAKAIYNQIFPYFDACSFISNIREAAKQLGLISLQEQLLRDVFNDENVKVSSIYHGISMITRRIKSKKVLLVLDDIDSEPQLHALVGSVDWFCPGSRIIITSRDQHVLTMVKQNYVYELKKLDATQSLELFCWHAFQKKEPDAKFAELSKEVASVAAGLPLALVIFGSHFFDLETVREWEDLLEKFKRNQHKEIHERLRVSFDALDEREQKVFLDIACLFIGQGREHATFMWEGCRFSPEIAIKVLMRKSLVNINKATGEFEMHDHIRDMGRRIVEDKSCSNPGRCSRLWKEDDVLYVLQNKRGTESIEAINPLCGPVSVDAESFAAMSQLRMLRLGNVTLEGEPKNFPQTLRWLEWCPERMDSLPDGLHLEKIVVLDLSGSSITQVWNSQRNAKIKVLKELKVLHLNSCRNLTICPDFMCMPNLKKLDFGYCNKIAELDRSIGHLKCLIHLSLRGCNSLKELPKEVCQLTSLEELDLTECKQITAFPSQLEDSKSLKQLLLDKLKVLILRNCENLITCPNFMNMPYLETLDFRDCKKISALLPSIGHLKMLTHLSLSGCHSLTELPKEVCQLTSLEELDLTECYQLTAFPSQLEYSKSLKRLLLEKLKVLKLRNCENLITCPDFTNMPYLEKLDFGHCYEMSELHPSIGLLKSLTVFSLSYCESLKELPQEIFQLTSLEKFDLSHCSEIVTLTPCSSFEKMRHDRHCESLMSSSNSFGNLRQLRMLDLSGMAIEEIPDSIMSLKKLEVLSVAGCDRLKFLPASASIRSTSLKSHEVSSTSDEGVSSSERQHYSLPQFPSSLTRLHLTGCCELKRIADVSNAKGLQKLDLRGCRKLEDVPGIKLLKMLKSLKHGGCRSFSNSLRKELRRQSFNF